VKIVGSNMRHNISNVHIAATCVCVLCVCGFVLVVLTVLFNRDCDWLWMEPDRMHENMLSVSAPAFVSLRVLCCFVPLSVLFSSCLLVRWLYWVWVYCLPMTSLHPLYLSYCIGFGFFVLNFSHLNKPCIVVWLLINYFCTGERFCFYWYACICVLQRERFW
jgi:hypothetical protein